MKSKKIIWIIVALVVVAIVASYFLCPLKAWKEGKTFNVGAEKVAYNPQTCTYVGYCAAWWKCKFLKETAVNSENFTYNGGELSEVEVTPTA